MVRDMCFGDTFVYKYGGVMRLASYCCLMDDLLAKPPNQARCFVLDFCNSFKINEENNSCDAIKNLIKVKQASADFISPKQILGIRPYKTAGT